MRGAEKLDLLSQPHVYPWFSYSSEPHHQFPFRLIRLHPAMSLLDVCKAKYPRWFRFVAAVRGAVEDGWQWNIGQGKFRSTEYKTAEEAEPDATRHLQQRVERGEGSKATQKACRTDASEAPNHGAGVQHKAIADEIQHGIDAVRVQVANAEREIRAFQLNLLCSWSLQFREALPVAGCLDDVGAGLGSRCSGRPVRGLKSLPG
jgi:hypothetical protein